MLEFAALVVLLCAAFAAPAAWKHRKWRAACRAGAARIYGEVAEMYRGEHAYRVASQADFPDVDKSGYRSAREGLEAQGFRYLGAFENLTVTRVHPAHRTFIEAYVAADGIVGAGTYRVADRQTIELSSALEDGRFLATTNAELDTLTPPPAVSKCTLPADTPLEALLARHRERLAALRAAEPGARFLTPVTIEDVIDLSRRHSRLASDYRRGVGLLTQEEMMRFATEPGLEATTRRIWKEFERLRDRGAA